MVKKLGVLGMNARNLQYIKKFNPKKQIRLATNKHKTKEFLSQRGIPVPQTYAFITNRDQLFHYDFGSFPEGKFAVKPNRGSQGNGIYIVKGTEKSKKFDRKNMAKEITWLPERAQKRLTIAQHAYHDYFYAHLPYFPYKYHIGKKHIDDLAFKKTLVQTLDGQHRLGGGSDSILIEELIQPGEGFEAFCERGLADIRIIAFNLVPMVAYIRVPTEKSGGKANLAQGGIALGLDITTGRVKSLGWKGAGKVYTDEFPDEYKHFKGMKLPFWDDILLLSANTQFFVNIGYIGLDWVITKKGPQLLEVNGRAGIEIQNITMSPLLKSIKKIDDIAVTDPKKGIEIAHSLFSKSKMPVQHTKCVYLSQKATLKKTDDNGFSMDVIAVATIKKKRNYVSKDLMKKLGTDRIKIHLPDTDIKANIHLYVSDNLHGNQLSLGTDFLEDYVLKTEHKAHPATEFIAKKNLLENEIQDLQILDQNIYALSKRVSLAKLLKPTNYLSELDTFVSKKGKYNPTFNYTYPAQSTVTSWRNTLQRMYDQHAGATLLQSDFANLLYDKMKELDNKISLIEAYMKQDLSKIAKYNKALYGDFDATTAKLASETINNYTIPSEYLGKKLSGTQVKKIISDYLIERKIEGVPVYTTTRSMSRLSVGYKHQKPFIQVLMTNRGSFREGKLSAKLVHEIDVHLMRYLNGQKTGWNIMTSGTAGYITDEEGLAIWKAEQAMKEYVPEFKSIAIYQKYDRLMKAQTMNFRQLAEYIMQHKTDNKTVHTYSGIYNTCLKLKRGIQKTKSRHKGAVYIKDKVYLDGYEKIRKHIEANGGEIDERFMVGKIKLDDIPNIFGKKK